MIWKAPLTSDGIVVTRGKMEKVEGRANATELLYGDADFLQRRAWEEWSDLDWQIEKTSEQKYIVMVTRREKVKSRSLFLVPTWFQRRAEKPVVFRSKRCRFNGFEVC